MTLQPWITCLQSGILIRHLEARYPEQASKVDFKRVMGVADSFQEIQDARAFLTDSSNWVPVSVFRELIKACELASGEKTSPIWPLWPITKLSRRKPRHLSKRLRSSSTT